MADPAKGGNPPHARLGQFAAGTVSLVRQWGVYVDLGLEHPGYIDPIHVQDELYEVGDRVEAFIVDFRERSAVYELRPKGKTSLMSAARVRAAPLRSAAARRRAGL